MYFRFLTSTITRATIICTILLHVLTSATLGNAKFIELRFLHGSLLVTKYQPSIISIPRHTLAMFPPSIFLVVLVTILPICAGFQSVKMFDRLLMKRNVVEKDNYAKISTFQELMKAIIEAIPTVLKPAKEMDRSKVINNPPKFLKVRIL